jgi:hypothetical protein
MKKDINWDTIDQQIKNLKFPLSFIYNIIKNQNKIEDYHLSLIIRYFLKNQTKISLQYPLFSMFNILDSSFIITKQVINEYYSSILKKYIFIEIILKFKKSYNNINFWNKDFNNQRIMLETLYNIFKAHFDSSITGINGVSKFLSQIKCKNNSIILKHIKWRLSDSVKLLGADFIRNNNIRLITEDEFDNLCNNDKIKYILYYYIKMDKCFRLLINIYDLLFIYDNKIKQIINPKPIYINFTRIYSENDSDDISLLIN